MLNILPERLLSKMQSILQSGAISESADVSPVVLPELPSGAPCEPSAASSCEVWIVRHGERYDEVPGNTWYETSGFKLAWLDPPLTACGRVQAEHAAVVLDTMLRETHTDTAAPLIDAIFSSPLQRCIATAAAAPFSRIFNLPIRPVPGLAECAAALRGEATSKATWEKARLPLMRPEQLQELCPGGGGGY
jgi:hypothetical protein